MQYHGVLAYRQYRSFRKSYSDANKSARQDNVYGRVHIGKLWVCIDNDWIYYNSWENVRWFTSEEWCWKPSTFNWHRCQWWESVPGRLFQFSRPSNAPSPCWCRGSTLWYPWLRSSEYHTASDTVSIFNSQYIHGIHNGMADSILYEITPTDLRSIGILRQRSKMTCF